MTTTGTQSKPVLGEVRPANGQGFRDLIDIANQAHEKGYRLLTIVRVGDGLAAVFVHDGEQQRPQAPPVGESFFE